MRKRLTVAKARTASEIFRTYEIFTVKVPHAAVDRKAILSLFLIAMKFRSLFKGVKMEQANRETRDGFEVRQREFYVPRDSVNLDPKTKRSITICNLFLNHRLDVSDIAHLLDEDQGKVVSTLLQRGVITERRQQRRASTRGNRTPDLPGSNRPRKRPTTDELEIGIRFR